jgi:DUF4097 and DUF4098 domain-containing protein YvlB
MRKAWLLGVVLAGVVTATPARADDWRKKYSISGHTDLRAVTNDGDVEITGTDQKEIDVHVTTVGWGIPSDVHISENQSGDHVTIDVRTPRTSWNLFGGGHHSLRIELRVPREAGLDIRTGDGNVTAQSVSGRIQIETGDGNITADGLKGDVKLHTGDGNVDGRNVEGVLNADTGDGHLVVRGRFDVLNLKTGDGNIDAEAGNGSQMSSGWSLQSGDGHINLRVPAEFHADLDAHTGDGHISMDFPVTVSGSLSTSTIRGKLNGGGQPLSIRSGDGSIRLEHL